MCLFVGTHFIKITGTGYLEISDGGLILCHPLKQWPVHWWKTNRALRSGALRSVMSHNSHIEIFTSCVTGRKKKGNPLIMMLYVVKARVACRLQTLYFCLTATKSVQAIIGYSWKKNTTAQQTTIDVWGFLATAKYKAGCYMYLSKNDYSWIYCMY